MISFLQKLRGKDENVLANFKQYGVFSNYIDVLVADASRQVWRDDLRFDCIITDRKRLLFLCYVYVFYIYHFIKL